jgi:hypothetical protein
MVYFVGTFIFYLKFDAEIWTQVLLLVIGFLGIFASNPISYFLPSLASLLLTDSILLAVYVSSFRLFLILELDLLRSRKLTPSIPVILIVGIAFAYYATVDAFASFERTTCILNSERPSPTTLVSEDRRVYCDALYAIVSVFYVGLAATNRSLSTRRLVLFSVLALASSALTVLCHTWPVMTGEYLNDLLPSILFKAVHVSGGGIALSLLRTADEREYAEIDGKEQEMALDIERASDDEIIDEEEEGEE